MYSKGNKFGETREGRSSSRVATGTVAVFSCGSNVCDIFSFLITKGEALCVGFSPLFVQSLFQERGDIKKGLVRISYIEEGVGFYCFSFSLFIVHMASCYTISE